MRVALVQIDVIGGKPEENRKRVLAALGEARKKMEGAPSAVAVLPEMWNTSYELEGIEEIADRDGQATLELAKGWVKESGCHLLAGSVADLREGRVFNTAYGVNRDGDVVCRYSKAHLFRLMDEHKHLTAGDEPALFQLDGILCGVIICYDLRFPEWMRMLALRGAKVVFVPAQWPEARLHAWRSLLVARAIENQCYVVGVNRPGWIDPANPAKGRFPGHSMVVDPVGQIVAEGGDGEEILIADLDLTQVEKMRRHIPVFKDRRKELYRFE